MILWFLLSVALANPVAGAWEPTVSVLRVRVAPDDTSDERGRLVLGEPFAVVDGAEGPGCGLWGRVGEAAWVCLDHAVRTEREPVQLPRLIAYEPPHPDDYDAYHATGVIPTPRAGEGLLPFVYARRWKTWRGRMWADLAAWERGDAPIGALPAGRRARFGGVAETASGRVFLTAAGRVVPESEVYVFPVSRLAGRDLVAYPLPEGAHAAWVVDYDGAALYGAPVPLDRLGHGKGTPIARIPYHTALEVVPVPDTPRWWRVVGGSTPGFVEDVRGVRVRREGPRPDEVAPDALWVDIDRATQTLGVLQGDVPIYTALVSTGLARTPTPLGLNRIYLKKAWTDMRSRETAAEPYHVEAVPWAAYFRPMYALHGAYWHWGFGHPASHGCVNLAPRDAAWIFDRIQPAAPPGWLEVAPGPGELGTWVRVR